MAFGLAVYASQDGLPRHHARLASGRWSGATGRAFHPQDSNERFQSCNLHLIPLSQALLGAMIASSASSDSQLGAEVPLTSEVSARSKNSAVLSTSAVSEVCRFRMSTLSPRHQSDDTGRPASQPRTAFGHGHRRELETLTSRRGLSNLREFAIRSIAGGVVDSVQFSLVGNWALGVINLMTKCQTY